MEQQKPYNFKVVLLGEGCVGKTSLVLRYVEDIFNPKHISTVQVIDLVTGVPCTIDVFVINSIFYLIIISIFAFPISLELFHGAEEIRKIIFVHNI